MSVSAVVMMMQLIEGGKYKNPEPYPRRAPRPATVTEEWRETERAWQQEQRRLDHVVFEEDLANHFELNDHPNRKKIFQYAWDERHAGGLVSVLDLYDDLATLIKIDIS